MVLPVTRAGRAATLQALLRPTGRVVGWLPFGVGAGVGLAMAGAASRLFDKLGPADAATLLRMAAVCGALGAAFLLDDPAVRTTRVVAVGRGARLGVRLALVVPVLALWWGAALAIVGSALTAPARLPVGALTVEAAALVCGALAVAAGTVRGAESGRAGPVAAPVVVFGVVVAFQLPYGWALIVPPGDARWTDAHQRWGVLVGVGLAGLWWAGREPVRDRAARLLRAVTR
ncbi:hypothetical protein Val02_34420 [Virgisporangium aliadipatigenens]|uniref:ABC transporter n=1 Tax=Virgisporangium aliadipatigenens TaxID=741659 RepID=A0A8J4DR01_9ACTN|nr:hypothetical protein [Virgisporangium aliadipatigenens]GIJ46556.1 hypothetical protein Val02_34420 [Virgisporangium aliadipatigenens]